MKEYHKPRLMVRSVLDVPYAELAARGVKVFVHDVDNTLALQGSGELSGEVAAKIKEASRYGKILVASNNHKDRTAMFPCPVEFVQPKSLAHWLFFRKPYQSYFRAIVERAGVPASQIAMIDDKYFFGINPAERLGMTGVLVNPMGEDLPLDQLMQIRRKENKVLWDNFRLKRPA